MPIITTQRSFFHLYSLGRFSRIQLNSVSPHTFCTFGNRKFQNKNIFDPKGKITGTPTRQDTPSPKVDFSKESKASKESKDLKKDPNKDSLIDSFKVFNQKSTIDPLKDSIDLNETFDPKKEFKTVYNIFGEKGAFPIVEPPKGTIYYYFWHYIPGYKTLRVDTETRYFTHWQFILGSLLGIFVLQRLFFLREELALLNQLKKRPSIKWQFTFEDRRLFSLGKFIFKKYNLDPVGPESAAFAHKRLERKS